MLLYGNIIGCPTRKSLHCRPFSKTFKRYSPVHTRGGCLGRIGKVNIEFLLALRPEENTYRSWIKYLINQILYNIPDCYTSMRIIIFSWRKVAGNLSDDILFCFLPNLITKGSSWIFNPVEFFQMILPQKCHKNTPKINDCKYFSNIWLITYWELYLQTFFKEEKNPIINNQKFLFYGCKNETAKTWFKKRDHSISS